MSLGIREGQIVKVWSWEDKGKYAVVRMSSSRKDKITGEYKSSNWAFVRFVGEAYNKIKNGELNEGDLIELHGCTISLESYVDNNIKKYPKSPSIVVFNWVPCESKTHVNNNAIDTEDMDDENIPF